MRTLRTRYDDQANAREEPTVLAVVDPTDDLAFANSEGRAVVASFGEQRSKVLAGSEATPQSILSSLENQQYLHFCCHGLYSWMDCLYSGLLTASGPLTLAQILAGSDLRGCRLVTLSACDTGVIDAKEARDEFLGLPAGFLQAGAAAVVSTLWEVNDLSTMLLVERFYELHLGDRRMPPVSALAAAQCWVRDATAFELRTRFAAERGSTASRFDSHVASQQFRRFAALPGDARPYQHPVYWAAFTLTGL